MVMSSGIKSRKSPSVIKSRWRCQQHLGKIISGRPLSSAVMAAATLVLTTLDRDRRLGGFWCRPIDRDRTECSQALNKSELAWQCCWLITALVLSFFKQDLSLSPSFQQKIFYRHLEWYLTSKLLFGLSCIIALIFSSMSCSDLKIGDISCGSECKTT